MTEPESDDSRPAPRLRRLGGQAVGFVRDYTAGLRQRDVKQLFDREATQAFSVLTADRTGAQAERGLRALPNNLRLFLLGLAFKLSPPRRLLFAVSLLAPLLGFLDLELMVGSTHLSIDFSPVWFLVALAGMTLLLALELADRLRVRDELEVARALQRDLLPQQPPAIPGYRVACSSRTANEIGGDFFDFVALDQRRVAIAIGDASGHGIGAGLLMAIAHATLRTAVDLDPAPAAVGDLLNRVLCRTGGRRAFMSFFYGVLDRESGRLRYFSAGHPYPLLRDVDGRLRELGSAGPPLGLRHPLPLETGEATVACGELLALYSDGLPEAVDGADDAFGFDRVETMVAVGGAPQALHDRILGAVDVHRGERALADDLTLVILAREG